MALAVLQDILAIWWEGDIFLYSWLTSEELEQGGSGCQDRCFFAWNVIQNPKKCKMLRAPQKGEFFFLQNVTFFWRFRYFASDGDAQLRDSDLFFFWFVRIFWEKRDVLKREMFDDLMFSYVFICFLLDLSLYLWCKVKTENPSFSMWAIMISDSGSSFSWFSTWFDNSSQRRQVSG